MPADIAAMDIIGLLNELQVLEDARIDKFYQRGNDVIMHAYKPGDKKYRLYLGPGKIFFTDYKREMPQHPPGFCMALRKHLNGQVIQRVEQYDFDRIMEIHTDEHVLIAELFGEGNVVLTNKNDEIIAVLQPHDRATPGQQYQRPDPTIDPADRATLDAVEGELVVGLATAFGLGGRYAEEVCARAGVDKHAAVDEMDDAEQEAILTALQMLVATLRNGDLDPRVYSDADGPLAATPIPFTSLDNHAAEQYDTFSRALDQYFTEAEKAEELRRQRAEYREERERLERRLEQQEAKLEGLEEAAVVNKEKADLIYEQYTLVEDVLNSVRAARDQYSEDEIRERLESEQADRIPEAEAIQRLDLGNNAVVVDIGKDVHLDLDLGVERNAEQYYEKGKAARDKLDGVKAALEETRTRLDTLSVDDVSVEDKFADKRKKKEEKQWYEKFRWCYSSDGFLIIAGRDTTTNDMLVKKYMDPHDVYVHAEFQGAPSVVIKTDGEAVPESTITEASQVAVTYATAWAAGVTAETAYHVTPEQVTQEPESGEYLPKGSFVIRGDRTYLKNLPIEAAVGLYEEDDRAVPMGGPPAAVKEHCDHYVVLEQGREKPSDVAKTIRHHLEQFTDERLDLDAIIRALPPGNAGVRETH